MNKEQLNDSLKNSDKNFNENFTHEKEQIIIDGVKVLKEKINMCFILLLNKLETPETIEQTIYEHLDAFVKEWNTQLARKTQECEELKKANQHIDANRQCKGSKLKRIEDLISACEAGYTDEFIQKIYSIIQEPEPAIDDYSIIDGYRKALEEIEVVINNLEKQDILTFPDFSLQENYKIIMKQCNEGYRQILNLISKAKGEEND